MESTDEERVSLNQENNNGNSAERPSQSRNHSRLVTLLILLISVPVLVKLWMPLLDKSMLGSEQSSASVQTGNDAKTSVVGWIRPPVVFGHIHVGKTGGSTVNGYLAAHYERVCGNKGRSYNAFPYNAYLNRTADAILLHATIKEVPLEANGWEDCDYISLESRWQTWNRSFVDWDMEMHVPCRDPVDHLMSMANHKRKIFNCQAEDLDEEIERCFLPTNKKRFSTEFVQQENFDFKCFAFEQLGQYLDYMGNILQRRRLEVDYVKRLTNRQRNKEDECIWKNHSLEEQVRSRMLEMYDYYSFCQDCLNSNANLLQGG